MVRVEYIYMIISFMQKNKLTVIVAIIVLIILIVIYFTTTKKEMIDLYDEQEEIEVVDDEVIDTTLIKVYVTGEVKEKKIVEVEKGIILNDLINLCGGLTDEASLNINLVYEINNNVTIVIKGKNSLDGVDIISDGGDVTIIDDESGMIEGKVNINKATYDELLLLPGIGESTANAIILYRKQVVSFSDIKEIMNVPGIKEAKYNSIKELIAVY